MVQKKKCLPVIPLTCMQCSDALLAAGPEITLKHNIVYHARSKDTMEIMMSLKSRDMKDMKRI